MNLKKEFHIWIIPFILMVLASCAAKQAVVASSDHALSPIEQKVEEKAPPKAEPLLREPIVVPQAQKAIVDKKIPKVIPLGEIAEIETLGSFSKLTQKKPADADYEKQRIEYLLERMSRSSYNFVRNGETHDSKKAVLLMRYKWAKFKSEVITAEDFVSKIAAGSRTSGEPYYMKAHHRFYLVKDVLFFELEQLDEARLRYQAGKAD